MKSIKLSVLGSKKEVLKSVMTKAWAIYKSSTKSFKMALVEAWKDMKDTAFKILAKRIITPLELIIRLRKEITQFGYIKKDGSYRVFEGTVNLNLINPEFHPTGYERQKCNISFFDYNAMGWRSLANNTKEVFVIE